MATERPGLWGSQSLSGLLVCLTCLLVWLPAGTAGMQVEVPLEATQELRLGSYDDEYTSFSGFGGLTVDHQGRIYVLQSQLAEIRVFDSEGAYLRTIGRMGRGPGEFMRPTQLGIRHDSLWVVDAQLSRVTSFLPNGAWYRTNTVSPSWRDSVGTRNTLAGQLADDLFYGAPSSLSATVTKGLVNRAPFLRFDESGAVFDTLVWVDVDRRRAVEIEVGSNSQIAFMGQQIRDHTLVSVSPTGDHIVLADRRVPTDGRTQAFTVRRVAIDGDTLAEVAIEYSPTPLTGRYLDALIEPLFDGAGPFDGRVDEARYRDAIWKPDYLPPLERLVVGVDGSIWLGLLATEPFGRDRDWVILSPALDKRYRVEFPLRLELMQTSLNKIWGVARDSLGVPFVYRYGLRGTR